MSDFDFDELDKAVTGAISGTDTSSSDQSDQAASSSEPSREQPDASRQVVPDRPVAMPAARRGSSGRFMDMVHPSSDMRRTSGADAQPSSTGAQLPPPPVFSSQPVAGAATEETEATATATVLGVAPEPAPSSKDANWSTPLESPFLPGAKVEKRPLGGMGGEVIEPSQSLPKETSQGERFNAPEEELLLEAPDEPLLEATTLPDPIDFATSRESQSTEMPKEAEDTPATSSTPSTDEPPAGPTSITQQYKEQPATERQPGAIYDTEAYHQPVAHPAKKRSGAWVALWIFLLVALGAGAGVAFYFYVLPMI